MMRIKKETRTAIWEAIEVIAGLGMFLFVLFSFYMFAIRENGTHDQRVFWFGEDGAAREEAVNAKRKQKCD